MGRAEGQATVAVLQQQLCSIKGMHGQQVPGVSSISCKSSASTPLYIKQGKKNARSRGVKQFIACARALLHRPNTQHHPRELFTMRATRFQTNNQRRWGTIPASGARAQRSILLRHAKLRTSTRLDAAIVGIDLGTTNSLIATFKDGKPVVLADEDGNTSTPSVVSYAKASC